MSDLKNKSCIIEKRVKRTLYLGLLLSFIPDIIISLVVSFFTESYFTFFVIFISIQILNFFNWLKSSIFAWINFHYNRKSLANTIYKEFQAFNFPEPQDSIDHASNYLENIINNDQLASDIRLLAMQLSSIYRLQELRNELQNSFRNMLILEDAIILYKQEFNKT